MGQGVRPPVPLCKWAVSECKDDGQVSDEQKSDAGNLESQQEKQSDVQSESNSMSTMERKSRRGISSTCRIRTGIIQAVSDLSLMRTACIRQ